MKELKILIVSPFFAPFSGVGANRMISLAVFLQKQGHKVSVIRNLQDSLKNQYTAKEPAGIDYVDIKLREALPFDRMEDLYCKKIDELLNESSFDCAVLSVGPYYTLKSVEIIKLNYRIPVIIDFRDLYAHEVLRPEGLKNVIGHFVFYRRRCRKEQPAVCLADAVVTVVPDDRKRMSKYYSDYVGKIVTISNGYDEERLTGVEKSDSEEGEKTTFRIGVFGKLSSYSKSLTKKLFKAVKRVQDQGYSVELLHMGPSEPETAAFAEKLGLHEGTYHYLGSQEYSAGMSLLSKMDALSLVYCSPTGYGTKVFDYIYLNKPILLMGRKGTALGKFVRSFKNGFECVTVAQYEKAMLRIIENKAQLLDPEINPEMYSRKKQNNKFAELICEVTAL